MKMSEEGWIMPNWMEPLRHLVAYGDRAEELYNDDGQNSNVFNNAPLSLICVGLKEQINLLYRLYSNGVIDESAYSNIAKMGTNIQKLPDETEAEK